MNEHLLARIEALENTVEVADDGLCRPGATAPLFTEYA